MLRAIIFDMDGVLVDSEMVHYKADKDMLKDEYSIDLKYDYYKQFIGGTTDNMWNTIIWDFGIKGVTPNYLNSMADKYLEKELTIEGYPAVSGVVHFVKTIKEQTNLLFAVASSSSMLKINKNLRQLGLEKYFEVRVSGQDIGKSKPDPAVFLAAASELNVAPDECLVIEDSMNGVLAAKNANMACLGFINLNSGNQDLSAASALFESFENLDYGYINTVYCHYNGIPATILETNRLIIREIEIADVSKLYHIYKDENITKYMPGLYANIEDEIEYTKKYIQNMYGFYMYGMWIIVLKDTGEVIGRVGVDNKADVIPGYEHEFGYMIASEYQNKGYATEASKAVLRYLEEEFDMKDIFVEVKWENIPSYKLALSLGFNFDKELKENDKGYIIGTLIK